MSSSTAVAPVIAKPQMPVRAMIQVTLTSLSLITGIAAFVFSLLYRDDLAKLSVNLTGEITNPYLPCVRKTLPVCDNSLNDKCYDRCCPIGFVCRISPIVGLYCQNGNNGCDTCQGSGCSESFSWCRDLADISGQCKTSTCTQHALVVSVALAAFLLTGFSIFSDMIDVVAYFAAPDSVKLKAGVNVLSFSLKLSALVSVLGAASLNFAENLSSNKCFAGDQGVSLLTSLIIHLLSFIASCSCSVLFDCLLIPFSAYYGGKLSGVPFVPTSN